jgi:hypothetical protein
MDGEMPGPALRMRSAGIAEDIEAYKEERAGIEID